jgi:hypothetical protein
MTPKPASKPVEKSPPGLRIGRPRTIGQLMVVVALSGLAFTALAPRYAPPRPARRTLRAVRAVPIQAWVTPGPAAPTSIDERFVHPAAEGIDPKFVVQAPSGIDDGMVVPAEHLWKGSVRRARPVPDLFPAPDHGKSFRTPQYELTPPPSAPRFRR